MGQKCLNCKNYKLCNYWVNGFNRAINALNNINQRLQGTIHIPPLNINGSISLCEDVFYLEEEETKNANET